MASIDLPDSDTDAPYLGNRPLPRALALGRVRAKPPFRFADHIEAAKALSAHLNRLGVDHAYIGGFAWVLLGSIRATEINVLIVGVNIEGLRERVMDVDRRFADERFKFYFITEKDFNERLSRGELLRNSRYNVHIDTLPAGQMGLPTVIRRKYDAGGTGIMILHPTILILTKFKRWSMTYTSTRPKTVKKVASDRADIQFIIDLLARRQEKICFHEYEGKTKPELLTMLRHYHDKYADDVDQMAKLRSIMPDEWDDMLALPKPEVESNLPP